MKLVYIYLGKRIVKKHLLHEIFDKYDKVVYSNSINTLKDNNSIKFKVYKAIPRDKYLMFLNWCNSERFSICKGIQSSRKGDTGTSMKKIRLILKLLEGKKGHHKMDYIFTGKRITDI